jgi:dihydrodipicolinate synthase/N-acetylneuraminate lyase
MESIEMSGYPMLAPELQAALMAGMVIPPHPLVLTHARKLDERRQQALTRYYHAAGAGGVAVGVHTTQFAIHDPKHGLFQPVLELAVEAIAACDQASGKHTVKIAGICGLTPQALAEARTACDLGYDLGLLSLAALKTASEDELIRHCLEVAQVMPLFGFYLQPAVGGRLLSFNFWRRFGEIPNVAAIKIAPFNRYQTLDVIRGVAESGRADEIALYTGNDDHIVLDLISEYAIQTEAGTLRLAVVGGLLGHWSCWTQRAVELLNRCQSARQTKIVDTELLTRALEVTDSNAAIFDAANGFAGSITGIHEVLRRQGLLENILCLDPAETLSPGQADAIDRVYHAYPHLNDDDFVRTHLDEWLR